MWIIAGEELRVDSNTPHAEEDVPCVCWSMSYLCTRNAKAVPTERIVHHCWVLVSQQPVEQTLRRNL
ncbi:hypothetical protein U1Q18_004340 [Sarracenia purpurea var. burkii]